MKTQKFYTVKLIVFSAIVVAAFVAAARIKDYLVIDDGTNTVGLGLSSDRIYHDTNNNQTKDAGEEFIDLAGGDVFKVGTPVDNQIGVWTGDGTIEGDSNRTWDGITETISSPATTQDGLKLSCGSLTTGRGLHVVGSFGTRTSGVLADFLSSGVTGDQSGSTFRVRSTRTASSGTVTDDFHHVYFERDDGEFGGTLSSSGSVLRLKNISDGNTDSVNVLEISQDADSSGDGINIDMNGGGGNAIALDGDTFLVSAVGAITGITLDTGQGANELYAMDQAVQTTDTVSFGSVESAGGLGLDGGTPAANTIVGGGAISITPASGSHLTMNPTGAGSLVVEKGNEAGVAETILDLSVDDDATANVALVNATSTDGALIPEFQSTTFGQRTALSFRGRCSSDAGANPAILLAAQTTAPADLATRPILEIFNRATFKLGVAADGALTWVADVTTDTAPNDDTTPKQITLQKLSSAPTNAAYIAFQNNPGTDTFYLVLEEK